MRYSDETGSFPKMLKWIVPLAVILLLGLITIPLSCEIVSSGHRGVMLTMGKPSEECLSEGLNWKKPFIQTVVEVSVKQETKTSKTSAFSSDLQTMSVQYSVLYKLPEANVVKVYRDFKGDPYQSLIEPRVNEALKTSLSKLTAEDAVKSRDKVKQETKEAVNIALAGTLNVIDIVIENVDLSDLLEQAIEKKQASEQEAKAKLFELEKERTQAEIAKVKATGEAEALIVKSDALTKSSQILFLEFLQKWDGKLPNTLLLGGNTPGFVLPDVEKKK